MDDDGNRGSSPLPDLTRPDRRSGFRGVIAPLVSRPRALLPAHVLKGNMQNPAMDLALDRLRLARDLIISTHVTLKDQGINT